MKKLICNVLAYLFLVNPLMASTTPVKLGAPGILDINSKPLTIEQLKQKFSEAGLTATEQAEVSSYLDFAIANKIAPEQAKLELTAMLNNVSFTGASLDGDTVGTIALVALAVVLLVWLYSDDGSSSGGSSYSWTCFADSPSWSSVGYGSTLSSAQTSALNNCTANSYYYETCYSYASECY